jgi:hypothetical protein
MEESASVKSAPPEETSKEPRKKPLKRSRNVVKKGVAEATNGPDKAVMAPAPPARPVEMSVERDVSPPEAKAESPDEIANPAANPPDVKAVVTRACEGPFLIIESSSP